MTDAISVSAPISGTDRTMSFEAGKLAQLADGAVVARIGDTVLLATAVAARSVREGTDFFPLTVDIEERAYAAGKIPGSFFRREGKASDQAILTDRLIDRPLRPSFPEGFRNEVHIVGTIIGADQVNPHDVLAINAASAALMISGIPFDGPIGAVRIAYTTEGQWIPHPTFPESAEGTFELVVAGRALSDDADSEIAIMMVEAGGTEKSWSYYESGAPKVTEEVLAAGLEAAKQWIRESIVLQRQLVDAFTAARGPIETIPYSTLSDYQEDVWQRVVAVGTDPIAKANLVTSKAERNAALDAAGEEIKAALAEEFPERGGEVKGAIRALTKKLVRKRIVEEGVRIDGRGTSDIRPLSAEIDLLPTAHGSALFQRGETQVLNVTTLGMPRMNQLLDTITPVESKRYMHHYNFPPYSTGETGFMRGPKRREIGHGLLAERALLPVVPSEEQFPYALRVVSDVLASNGSTSMASVCGSTLSLMAAGVPIKAPVAGIAMGLVHDEGAYVTLTDILGAEDAFGDMDFKVAGTADAVTALQLDTKIDGLPADVLAKALLQAKEARLTILGVMAGAIAEPRDHVANSAPKIVSMEIPIDKIGEVIGPKGKVINTLQQETGADIAVDDDGVFGTVTIGAKDGNAVEEARRRISLILDPPTAEVGVIYAGKVVNITKFGAFVNVLPGRDGLLHISKLSSLAGGKRINNVEDVLTLGQSVEVRADDIDPQGKVSLSLATEPEAASAPGGRRSANGDGAPARSGGAAPASVSSASSSAPASGLSFEDTFEAELVADLGDLGPGATEDAGRGDRGDRGNDRRPPRPLTPSLIETTVLPCGIRLVSETMADVRSVAVAFWVGTGSRDEPGELAGASHFLEHLLFKGTERRSAAAIAEELDEVGGDCNAFTTKEYTTFYVRLLSEHLGLGLDILSDIMWAPALRPDDIEAERTVILDEILMHADEPADLASERWQSSLFPDHALGRDTLGTASSVQRITRDDIRAFLAHHYRPANMVVSVAGDCTHDAVATELERRFAGTPGGAAPVRTEPGPDVVPLEVVRRPTEQAHLVYGARTVSRFDDRRWAFAVLNHVLGGGLSSRLFQKVREQRGLAYSVWSERAAYQDAGSLAVVVGTAPEHVDEVLRIVSDELELLASEGVSARELAVAKGNLRAEMLLSGEDSGARMSRLGASLLLHGEVLPVDEVLARIEGVGRDEVLDVAGQLARAPRALSAVGPFDARDFESHLPAMAAR